MKNEKIDSLSAGELKGETVCDFDILLQIIQKIEGWTLWRQ